MTYGGPVYQNPDYPQPLAFAGARWVIPGWLVNNLSDFNPNSGKIYYLPIFVAKDTTFIRIGVKVTGAAGAGERLDLRIFAWDNGVPGSLILDAGDIDFNTVAIHEIVIAQTLSRGYYFLAMRATSAVGLLAGVATGNVVNSPVQGFAVSCGSTLYNCTLTYTGAWADPATAPDAASGWNFLSIYLREN